MGVWATALPHPHTSTRIHGPISVEAYLGLVRILDLEKNIFSKPQKSGWPADPQFLGVRSVAQCVIRNFEGLRGFGPLTPNSGGLAAARNVRWGFESLQGFGALRPEFLRLRVHVILPGSYIFTSP